MLTHGSSSGEVWRVASGDDLGRALADVRVARGMSQQELADAIGVQRSYLAEIEAGGSVLMIERLLRAFRRMGAEVTVTVPRPPGDER